VALLHREDSHSTPGTSVGPGLESQHSPNKERESLATTTIQRPCPKLVFCVVWLCRKMLRLQVFLHTWAKTTPMAKKIRFGRAPILALGKLQHTDERSVLECALFISFGEFLGQTEQEDPTASICRPFGVQAALNGHMAIVWTPEEISENTRRALRRTAENPSWAQIGLAKLSSVARRSR